MTSNFSLNQKWVGGGAVKEAVALCSKTYITYMDGDGSYNPKALTEMKSCWKS